MAFTKYPRGKCPRCDKWNYLNDWGFCLCNGCSSLYEPQEVWQPPFIVSDDLILVFGIGKHKGEPVIENLGYADWLAKQPNFPFPDVLKAIKANLNRRITLV